MQARLPDTEAGYPLRGDLHRCHALASSVFADLVSNQSKREGERKGTHQEIDAQKPISLYIFVVHIYSVSKSTI